MSEDWIKVKDIDQTDNATWTVSVDGFFQQRVSSKMGESMPEDSITEIFNNAASILSNCPDPHDSRPCAKTGIVIGKVQSGKTSNFISLLALAFDNGYNVGVVLGGNNLNLLKQNKDRLLASFNVSPSKLVILATDENAQLIKNPSKIKQFINTGKKVVLVGLKHTKHIESIAKIFEDQSMSNEPVLIIDDEGDQATLNTKVMKSELSSIYSAVTELKNKIKRHCFVSVTATPQANILISTLDILSPDFGKLVYPGDGYRGLKAFHGDSQDRPIEIISGDETTDFLDPYGIPESFVKALCMFFVSGAIRKSRGDFGKHAMLVHPSMKVEDHKIVAEKIDNLLNEYKEIVGLVLSGVKDISYTDVLRIKLKEAYDEYVKDGVVCLDFDKLENTILQVINECSNVHMCNSNTNAAEDAKWYDSNIFVGGNLVERGITIDGLAITYITRRAKLISNVDNTEQRARWFGYKAKYFDICRVFMIDSIREDFVAIMEHDEDMWETIERARMKGIAFKDMSRIFTNNRQSHLRLTRPSVAQTEGFACGTFKYQKYYPLTDECMAVENLAKVMAFKNRFKAMTTTMRITPIQTHEVIENLSYNELYDHLLSKLSYLINETLDDTYFRNLYEALIKVNIDAKVDVVFMRTKTGQERKIDAEHRVQQLFQGRNPNTASPEYYKGDRSLDFAHPTNIQVQIHNVTPSNVPEVKFFAPMIAIDIPDEIAEKLNKLVGVKRARR